MEISLYDIIQDSVKFSNILLTDKMQENNDFSYDRLSEVRQNVFATPYAYDAAVNIAVGAIESYHKQLRQVLIEKSGIDIGEINA